MSTTAIRRALAAVVAALLLATVAIVSTAGTSTADTGLAGLELAQVQQANCRVLLAGATSSGQRNRATTCIADQQVIIDRLAATSSPPVVSPSPSPSMSPTATDPPTPSPTVTQPTPSSTPTPTPPPPGPRVCPDFPAMPDASCTGVPQGVSLHPCGYFINAPGTYDSCLFDGVSIDAPNVTITRSKVIGRVAGTTTYDSGRNLRLVDVEIDGSTVDDPNGQAAIGQDGWSCLRCHVHHTGRGASIGDNVTIRDSYFHDFKGVAGAHMSAAGSNGGANNIVVHNNLDCVSVTGLGACSGALVAYGDFAQVDSWLIQNNLFNSPGSYCLYAGSTGTASGKPYPHGTNIDVIDNVWGRKYAPPPPDGHTEPSGPRCGIYGPFTAWENNTGNQWSGNAWITGEAITV